MRRVLLLRQWKITLPAIFEFSVLYGVKYEYEGNRVPCNGL